MDTPKSMWPPKNYIHNVTVEPSIPKAKAIIKHDNMGSTLSKKLIMGTSARTHFCHDNNKIWDTVQKEILGITKFHILF